MQSWQNYQELLDGRSDLEVPHDEIGVVDTIMLSEREAIFCESLDQAAQAGEPHPDLCFTLTIRKLNHP